MNMKKILILITVIGLFSCEKDENTTDKLKDFDGNTYETVTIGNQIWMAENLKTTHYPDGTKIPEITECEDWKSLGANEEAFCYYENDSKNQYGGYYTYESAIKACPNGWHLPTKNEWEQLEIYLYNNGFNGAEWTALKAISGWSENGNDNFGFSALPGGRRYWNVLTSECNGQFYWVGEIGCWWSNTEYDNNFSYAFKLYDEEVHIGEEVKKSGLSVRYVKD